MLQRWLHLSLVCLFLLFQFQSHANESDNLEVATELPMGHWTISPDSKCDGSEITFHDGSNYFVPLLYRYRVAKWEPFDEVEATFEGFASIFTCVNVKNLNKNTSATLILKKIPEASHNAQWISFKESDQGQITLNNGAGFKALDKSTFFGLSTIPGFKLFHYWKEGDIIAILLTEDNGCYDLLNLTLWQTADLKSIVRCELIKSYP